MKLVAAILFLDAALHFFAAASACPSDCKCFGFNGEWIADCARRGLTSVTYSDFDPATTEIHLQYNLIEQLDEETFANVPNLKHLYLQSNRISTLPEKIFEKLPELESLRLNSNRIADIGTRKFESLKKLKLLYIHNNNLRQIEQQAFMGLDDIEQISVASNPHLTSINTETFVGLNNLTMVDMSGSALTTLEILLVSRIPKLDKVYTYDIDTLICDDKLERYLTWMLGNPRKAFGRATMTCAEPENLKGRSVTVVDPNRHYTSPGDCPAECNCFSSGDSHIADCSSKGLAAVPAGFAPETTEIFLQNNELTRLNAYDFLHLTKLEFLYLHNNKLNFIDLNAFTGAAGSLRQLTLNENQITGLAGLFSGMTSLEILNLNQNQVSRILQTDLSSMPNLVQFSANNNSLRLIATGTFDGLPSLKYLGLAQNRLENLPQDLWANNQNLYFVDISTNSLLSLPRIPASVGIFEARESNILSLTASSLENAINLQILDLSHNGIYVIEEDAFISTANLQTIYLSHNKMEAIEDNHFKSLRKLVVLDLRSNLKLASVSDNAFISQMDSLQILSLYDCGFSTMNGKALSVLHHPNFQATLEKNPWNCDCKLQDLSNLLSASPEHFDDPTCKEPKSQEGDLITEVKYEELCAESPPVEPITTDDNSALIISLTIVLALLVFAAVMVAVLSRSKTPKISEDSLINENPNGEGKATYVNTEFEDPQKTTSAQL